jgi:hypothetical protein
LEFQRENHCERNSSEAAKHKDLHSGALLLSVSGLPTLTVGGREIGQTVAH